MSAKPRVFGAALLHVPHPHGRADAGARVGVHPGAVLATICAVVFLVGVNTTAINTALTSIGDDLVMGAGEGGWAVGIYMLATAAFVVPGGKLGAVRVHRRRADVSRPAWIGTGGGGAGTGSAGGAGGSSDVNAVEPHDAVHRVAFDGRLALQLETELGDELSPTVKPRSGAAGAPHVPVEPAPGPPSDHRRIGACHSRAQAGFAENSPQRCLSGRSRSSFGMGAG